MRSKSASPAHSAIYHQQLKPLPTSQRQQELLSLSHSLTMGNFVSCTFSESLAQVRVPGFVATIKTVYDDLLGAYSGSSVVLSELDEAWYQELLGEVDTLCACCRKCSVANESQPLALPFVGPADTTVNSIRSWDLPTKSWSKHASNEDGDASADETDDESKCDFSDSEAESDEEEQSSASEAEYYKDEDDTETKVERLPRLSSLKIPEIAPVYVDDYLCPCGECPQYHRIACDVEATVTWRSVKEQGSIIRVLQAFSTYNEVIGYHEDMIEAAEECLQFWLGDEDRALSSLVMLYDKVSPQRL